MWRQELKYDEAVAFLINERAERLAANRAWAKQMFEDEQAYGDQRASLPRRLTPDLQASLPATLSLFRGYEVKHEQAEAALVAAYDWSYRTLRGDVVGIVLYSEENRVGDQVYGYGSGKTHLSRAAEQMLRWGGRHKGNWVSTVDLFARLQSTYNDNAPQAEYGVLLEYRKGWLVMDDAGKESIKVGSERWYETRYYQLINAVHESHSLFMTSNLALDDLNLRVGNAAAERLLGMCGETGFIDMSQVPSYRATVKAAEQDAKRAEDGAPLEHKPPYWD